MKKLLALPLLAIPLLATPASALTWDEFWEPFDDVEVHHYHHHRGHFIERKRPPVKRCIKHVERDRYYPGYHSRRYGWVPGYWETTYKKKLVPCWKVR